jgi:hypothetical protein
VRVGGNPWPPREPCFAPRLGDYLARLEQESLGSLLTRPAALGRALRRATLLLGLSVECLDVPAAWILHSAAWPATIGEHGIELGSAPSELRAPLETAGSGPLLAVREALRALPPAATAPATLVALPSPATLARAGSVADEWSRAVLQVFVRSLGEMDVLAGVMLDGDDGAPALGRLLDHYQLTPVCIRRPADTRPLPPGAIAARALPIEALIGPALAWETLVTTDGPVVPLVAPEELLRASRAVVECRTVSQAPGDK